MSEAVISEALKQAMFAAFDQLKRNTIQINWQPVAEPAPLGGSKIGGQPDLPADFVWPRFESADYEEIVANRPLAFMAQINLAEAAPFDREGLLPKQGLLSFFYDMVTERWGFDPQDKGCAQVFYFADPQALQPVAWPEDLDDYSRIPEFAVSFAAQTSLPDYANFRGTPEERAVSDRFSQETSQLDWEDYNSLRQEYGCLMGDDWSHNIHLLGYPDVIQGAMEPECELVDRGMNTGDGSLNISPEELAEVNAASRQWQLLFQLGTMENDEYELMFGDVGYIYFWIKRQDLAAANFANVWLILQCY